MLSLTPVTLLTPTGSVAPSPIDRETEAVARATARLDAAEGESICNRSLDIRSAGVSRQAELRDTSNDDGYVEEHVYAGIARARSGCGAAIVGDPDQVVASPRACVALGIDSFIRFGSPHLAERAPIARYVLPSL